MLFLKRSPPVLSGSRHGGPRAGLDALTRFTGQLERKQLMKGQTRCNGTAGDI